MGITNLTSNRNPGAKPTLTEFLALMAELERLDPRAPRRVLSKSRSRAAALAAVIAALDRAERSVPLDEDEQGRPGGEVRAVGSCILDPGFAERFDESWSPAAVRAVVVAYASNAPDHVLRRMARTAREQLAWLEEWDTTGRIEAEGWIPLPWGAS